jgi:hypothetical protein
MTGKLNIDRKLAEDTYGDNMVLEYADFHETSPIALVFHPYAHPISYQGEIGSASFWDIVHEVQQFFPVAADGIWTYQGFPLPDLGKLMCPATDMDCLLFLVKVARAHSSDPIPYQTHYVGAVHEDWLDGGGLAGLNERASVVTMYDGWFRDPGVSAGGQVLAHELGHNRGRLHNECTGREETEGRLPLDPYYPYPPVGGKCRFGPPDLYGLNVPRSGTGIQVVPSDGINRLGQGDIMSYDSPAWISDYTHGVFFAQLGGGGQRAATPLPPSWLEAEEYLFVSGMVNLEDGTVFLGHFYVLEQPNEGMLHESYARTLATSPAYSLTLENAAGEALYTHDFEPQVSSFDPAVPGTAGIHEFLPYSPTTARIVLHREGQEVAARQVSTHAPEVTILSPHGGETFTANPSIAWEASDADGDALRYTVKYTPDDGATWQVLTTGWSTPSLKLPDVPPLAGSDAGRVQVIATDGVNTTVATSEPFSMARHAPDAYITTPKNGAAYEAHQGVYLAGRGIDAEDGNITEASACAWTSDISGALGEGLDLLVSDLSVGEHHITLVVTDSDGMTGSDEIVIYVSSEEGPARVYLPLVYR